MNQEEGLAPLLSLLVFMPAGRATVTVGGLPILSINSDEKTLEVEIDRAREAGLHISRLIKPQGPLSLLKGSRSVSGALSRVGWKLTLNADGGRVLTMGSGVSRLTGRISVNPFRLKKLMSALR